MNKETHTPYYNNKRKLKRKKSENKDNKLI